MTRIWTLVLTVVALMSVAAPAAADPVTGWLAVNVFGWAGATIGAFLASAVVSLGTGILGAALTGVAAQQGQNYDVKFDVEFGDDTALTFTAGDFATAGKRRFIAKWGRETRFITEVIEISSLPQGFAGAWVNDERADLVAGKVGTVVTGLSLFGPSSIRSLPAHDIGAVPATHTVVGWPLSNMKDDEGEGDLGARIWVKWIDGTQTAADPFLLWAFGEDADYPWTANHIGTGKTYVIVTTRFDSETLTSYPTYLWEPEPLPLYDPRYDSTAGGQGAQRWGQRATYQPSRNAAVISYNIARGIYWGDEWLFGGKNMAQWRLPLAEWMAAMNACDMPVALAEGGTEPAYRAGLQITVSDEPLGVMEEIGKGANMRYAEVGGMLKPVVGLPAAPVFAITDADIVISEGQSLTPFAPASQTFNAITATFPDPTAKWASRDAPEYISEAGVAADGGRHLPTSLSYPAVPYPHQVQRLMRAQLEDYRRDTIVEFSLHPGAYALEPLVDTISWTSARNGYDAKQFVVEQVTKLPGMNVTVRLREVDPADYDWSPSFELPYDSVAPVPEIPWVQAIDGWTAVGDEVADDAGVGRVAAIRVGCAGDAIGIAQARIQARRLGASEPTFDVMRPYDRPYQWRITGVAPASVYEVRGALMSELTGGYVWSGWITVTTPAIQMQEGDLPDGFVARIEEMAAAQGIQPVDALPDAGARADQLVMIRTTGEIWRWDAAAGVWTQNVFAGVSAASLDKTKFAAGLTVPEVVDVLPATGSVGDMLVLTTDQKIYRWDSELGAWSNKTDGGDIVVNTLTGAAFMAGAVGAREIATGALRAHHVLITGGSLVPDYLYQDLGTPVGQGGRSWFWNAAQGVVFQQRFVDTQNGNNYGPQGVGIQLNTAPSTVTGNPWAWVLSGEVFPIKSATSYSFELGYWVSGGSRTLFRITYLDRDGNYVGELGHIALHGAAWINRFSVSGTSPATAKTAKLEVYIDPSYGRPVLNIGSAQLLERNAVLLIVEGGIQTQHLTSQIVTADKMAANSVTAANGAIADLAVNTLQIAGNAVTVPAYAYWEPSSPTFVTNSADYPLLELTVDRRGLATMITANAQLDGSSTDMRIVVWLLRNGQQVGGSYGYGGAWRQSSVINFVDWDTGQGPTTYTLMARTVVHASNVYQRYLSAHQFRR
ncbi:phage tail protein [Ketogulonicigenium vulgare]|uniref:Uncharacterized protein n=1 Tax=Ketogulonicigenium vulgare (strain WSH-001) TaxID=759362 RepID=F9Y9R2_KETVW|nr:phage tail protein [Ketogulonicigenium vulgare]ADO43109.1 conserved hypothetical protein [Ketogulonicigenium vulgare Y25]AEM41400.1 hypothetical protein KVU_1561 [Ketogulonicigenium vulgare WSH-001]ALJ81534.1 hypothetical protein KVH_10320 [Ketogulonicigenium vulgare]ANW34234.1 hypothetical protein KvSKV_10260 [Ketogulonicigenium vulgare]AOZ55144.1 phage tail fiber protein [Ketogulonicigenium vulgare]